MTYASKLINGGKVVIPADLRRKMGLSAGDTLVFEEDEKGQIVVKPYRQVLRVVQEEMRKFARPGEPAVDELLAERRREFEKDEEEIRESRRRAGMKEA
jgi:AbrB family looped-hinge helix DNA binding protein